MPHNSNLPLTQIPSVEDGNLIRVIGLLHRYIKDNYGGRGGKGSVLSNLACKEGPCSMKELLDALGTSSAVLSETIKKLEAEGLVQRSVNERDRRQVEVCLTAAGISAAHEAQQLWGTFYDHAFDCLSDKERTQLSAYLKRLLAYWNSLEDQQTLTPQEVNHA